MDDGAGVESSGWVSVRCVFRARYDGAHVYEERVTLWHTDDLDRAIEWAEAEALEYAAGLSGPPESSTEYVGLAQAYLLADTPGHGAEVFSLMRTSDLAPDEYLDTHVDTGREHERRASGPAI